MKSNFHLLFYLRKQKNYKGGPMAVYMRITVDGKRVEMSAGRECDPAKWSSHADRAIGAKEEIKSLNNYLDSLLTNVDWTGNTHYQSQLNSADHWRHFRSPYLAGPVAFGILSNLIAPL